MCLPLLLTAVVQAGASVLPEDAPVPELLRVAESATLDFSPDSSPAGEDVDLPDTAPQPDTNDPALPVTNAPIPKQKPVPEENSDQPPSQPTDDPKAGTKDTEPPPPADPRSAMRPDPSGKLPKEEAACRKRLETLGVKFKEGTARKDPSGCALPYPVLVRSFGAAHELVPEAEMNCATAETAARFTKNVISPAASRIFGEKLKTVSHASAYVCRPRAGTSKLSEHAYGNALDIASFTLSGDTTVSVELSPPEKNGKFLDKVRAAACGPFKTVLGPGSDPAHADHLHFDLAPRRNGGTVCQ